MPLEDEIDEEVPVALQEQGAHECESFRAAKRSPNEESRDGPGASTTNGTIMTALRATTDSESDSDNGPADVMIEEDLDI